MSSACREKRTSKTASVSVSHSVEPSQAGKDDLKNGFGFGVSLGRTFASGTYMAEGNLSVSIYQTIHYENPYDTFSVNITHYNYSILVLRRFRVESGSFIPSIGAGIGYGTTDQRGRKGELRYTSPLGWNRAQAQEQHLPPVERTLHKESQERPIRQPVHHKPGNGRRLQKQRRPPRGQVRFD